MSILSKFWLYNDSTQDFQLGTEITTFLVSFAVVMGLSSGQWEVDVGWSPLLPVKQNEEIVVALGQLPGPRGGSPVFDLRTVEQQDGSRSQDQQSPHQLWADCYLQKRQRRNIFLRKPPIVWLFCRLQPLQPYLVQTLAVLGALLCGTAMSGLAAL